MFNATLFLSFLGLCSSKVVVLFGLFCKPVLEVRTVYYIMFIFISFSHPIWFLVSQACLVFVRFWEGVFVLNVWPCLGFYVCDGRSEILSLRFCFAWLHFPVNRCFSILLVFLRRIVRFISGLLHVMGWWGQNG